MKKIFNTPEVSMMKVQASEIICLSSDVKTGIVSGGKSTEEGSGFSGINAREGVSDVSALRLN